MARPLGAAAVLAVTGTQPPGVPQDRPAAGAARPIRRLVTWGTYDVGKPRVRILLRGLREAGVEVVECHREVWGGVEDKSQVAGWAAKVRLGLRWLGAYPGLIYRYLRLPAHDAVLVLYLGQLDVLMLWPFARLRGVPIIWDAFLSLYNTVVEDRRLVGPRHPAARLLYACEWLACRAATWVVLDTAAQGRYFVKTFGVGPERVARVLVGAETDVFVPRPVIPRDPERPFTVLFYGQFIPLHGIETVVRAAKLCEQAATHWVIIGTGQEAPRIRALVAEVRPRNLEWIEWVPYPDLCARITAADACLGIFGTSGKALSVIPNKVYQILAVGTPLITADSPAARELLSEAPAVQLIEPGSPAALSAAVLRWVALPPVTPSTDAAMRRRISPAGIAADLLPLIGRRPNRHPDVSG